MPSVTKSVELDASQQEAFALATDPGRFDVILCRNVLMYFPVERRGSVLSSLADALSEDGVLVLGAGETVIGLSDRFVPCAEHRGFYRRAPRQERRLRA